MHPVHPTECHERLGDLIRAADADAETETNDEADADPDATPDPS